MRKVIAYYETQEFKKDFKKLKKKYKSLVGDFALAKTATIDLYYIGVPNSQGDYEPKDNKSILPIPGFCYEEVYICKIKKFACRSLGGGCNSGIRVIFAFWKNSYKVDFIEIYYKGDQEKEDIGRITDYLKAKIVL